MSHGRTQIRTALASRLTGLTTTGSRVFVSRVHPVTEAELPCLLISTDAEQVDHVTLHAPRFQQRQLVATVRILARATTTLDATLDTSLAEIETAIASDSTLGGSVRTCTLERIDITFDDGAERPTAQAIMTFQVDWATTEGIPQTPI